MHLTVLLSLYLHRVHLFSRQEHQGYNLAGTSLAGTEHETAFVSAPVPEVHWSIEMFTPKGTTQSNVTTETQKLETLYSASPWQWPTIKSSEIKFRSRQVGVVMWGVRWRGSGGAEKSLLMMLVAHSGKMKSLPALRNKWMCSSEVTSR